MFETWKGAKNKVWRRRRHEPGCCWAVGLPGLAAFEFTQDGCSLEQSGSKRGSSDCLPVFLRAQRLRWCPPCSPDAGRHPGRGLRCTWLLGSSVSFDLEHFHTFLSRFWCWRVKTVATYAVDNVSHFPAVNFSHGNFALPNSFIFYKVSFTSLSLHLGFLVIVREPFPTLRLKRNHSYFILLRV